MKQIVVPVLVSLAAVAAGVAIGAIPLVNEHLHWNIWFVIPISGALIGMGLAWMQFMGCFVLHTPVLRAMFPLFVITSIIGYAATDIGIWLTFSVPISGVEGVADGDYRIRDFMTFADYMATRLGSSSYTSKHGQELFEMGATGTTISFVADLIGAGLGALGMLFLLAPRYPYCVECRRFKKRSKLYTLRPAGDEEAVKGLVFQLVQLSVEGRHQDLVALLRSAKAEDQDTKSGVQVTADERRCPSCSKTTIVGKVFRLKGDDWEEIEGLSFGTTGPEVP